MGLLLEVTYHDGVVGQSGHQFTFDLGDFFADTVQRRCISSGVESMVEVIPEGVLVNVHWGLYH